MAARATAVAAVEQTLLGNAAAPHRLVEGLRVGCEGKAVSSGNVDYDLGKICKIKAYVMTSMKFQQISKRCRRLIEK